MPPRSRRALLHSLGAATVGLAGCQQLSDRTFPTTDAPTDTSTETSTPTVTDTPTDAATTTRPPAPLRCGPGPTPDAAWPLPERGATSDSYAPDGPVFETEPAVDWRVEPSVPDDVDARDEDARFERPLVAGDRVYVLRVVTYGTMEDDPGGHALQARDATTGDLQWSYRLATTPDPPAVRGTDVLVASDGTLHAVDREAETDAGTDHEPGTLRWKHEFPAGIDAVVPTREQVFVEGVGTSDRAREVVALGTDGTVEWRTSFDESVRAMAVDAGHVYASTLDGAVTALDRVTGAPAWTARTDRDGAADHLAVARSLVVTDCAVVAVTENAVFAFDHDGDHHWTAGGDFPTFATDGETLYGASQGGHDVDWVRSLRAVDAGTGEARWVHEAEVDAYEPAVLVDGAVYQPFADALVAVDAADGTVLWRRTTLGDLAPGSDALYGVSTGWDEGGALVALR